MLVSAHDHCAGPADIPDPYWSRFAHYEGPDRYPSLPPALWFRLVSLLRSRGELAHDCIARMARHLTAHCDERGRLVDVPELLATYGRRHGVTVRAAWNDWRRMVDARIIRQTVAAAPGRQARYVLALDVAALNDDLPADLGTEVRRYVDDPRAAARGRPTRADHHEALSECEVIRRGSTTAKEPTDTAPGAGRLHTSPYTREGSPPSPHDGQPKRAPRPPRRRFWEPGPPDHGAALYVVKAIRAEWKKSTTRRVVPSVDDLADVVRLVSVLLRYMPPGEAEELLTERTDSVRDLAGAARWRIGRALRALRRRTARPVDDDGSLWDAWHAERRAQARAQADRAAALIAQAQADAERIRAARDRAEAYRAIDAAHQRRARDLASRQSPRDRAEAFRARLASILRQHGD